MIVASFGLFKQKKYFCHFLNSNKSSSIIFWGRKQTNRESLFSWLNKDFLYLEDGFLRSLGLGVNGDPPLSLVVDDMGIYYDTTRPSRLEQLILQADLSDECLAQAKRAGDFLRVFQLSKYNHAPDFVPTMPSEKVVLVIDQTFGDMAVRYGQADEKDFQAMLDCAIAENPDAQIWVKTHPDVLSGKKRGYLTTLKDYGDKIRLFSENVNPISLLNYAEKVYCVTSQMGFEALLLDKPVVTFGVPWYAGWGLTDDRNPAIATLGERRQPRSFLQLFACAYLQYSRYLNPYNQQLGTIFDVIDYLKQAKQRNQRLAGKVYAVGMSLWKRAVVIPFFNTPACEIEFVSLAKLQKISQKRPLVGCKILVWGQGKPEILAFAEQHNLPLWRMEDGFIRSVGLGSNLVAPLSLVIDDLGIYFNAEQPSRLEQILQNKAFNAEELASAKRLREQLVASHIGKYNVGNSRFQLNSHGKKSLLVPGQVEDDASIRLGSPQIKRNLDLLKTVRANNPDAYILYKPHPDVVSGNRVGNIPNEIALQYADEIVLTANILNCIQQVDEVHTMTSLAGFEALLRHKTVHCYGSPFYAHWGLTVDHLALSRRSRTLTLDELTAGVLLDYPDYLNPQTHQLTNAQTAVEILLAQRQALKDGGLHRSWLAKQLGKGKQLWRVLFRQ
ncbi:capsular polysaccharide biosynthesis protein [Neisseria lisongii]|uniref:Capsular polysaccharide biosynthesis protein n=1 Tax=Neisseria lisongii TaxID=2912188 RepID=A0AAW5APD9_9NEIS|nr:capsular polysaccharide biosynthesis protein [Neisseria lisongii]MCF7530042.1 capsular polysaccharide biosynthesis protein [Neisseria lisongii]